MKSIHAGIVLAALCNLSACDKIPSEVSSTVASSQAAKPDPDAFLTRLYAHYRGKPADTSFSPTGAQAPLWFDREMVGLMAEDTRLANGEVGALDGDPICDCQDFGTLSANIKIEQATATTAKASVTVTETDATYSPEARQPRTFTYDLVMQDGDWRIHDIGTKNMPSLHDWLARSNTVASSR
ncbi:MAG: YbjP/YqhG family protein [Asticcacaulis sp.]|nr:YbjP/YqhG family protein [Asticcacaulis sp.]